MRRHPSRLTTTRLLGPFVGLLLTVLVVAVPSSAPAAPAAPAAASRCHGAAAFAVEGCNPLQRSGPLTPTTTRATSDLPSVYDRDCISTPPQFVVISCELAATRGRLHVALLGNSLASQWADAMAVIGVDHGWRVTTYLASGCPPSALAVPESTFSDPSASKRCLAWGRSVRDRMVRQGVDVVLVSAAAGSYGDEAAAEEGFFDYLRPLTTAGVLVETLARPPHPTRKLRMTPAACLRRHPGDYLACSDSREAWTEPDPLYAAGARLRRDRSGQIDLTDLMCTARTCVSAAGGVLLWRDGIHLTRTYVETLRPYLDERLTAVVRADR